MAKGLGVYGVGGLGVWGLGFRRLGFRGLRLSGFRASTEVWGGFAGISPIVDVTRTRSRRRGSSL